MSEEKPDSTSTSASLVDLAVVLETISREVKRYVVLDDPQVDAIALWVAHTYALDHAAVSPILMINAPERACAKSLLQEVIALFVLAPLQAANSSLSSIFRTLAESRATLIIDELDTFGRDNPEFQGILNAGYSKNGAVLRTEAVGDGFRAARYTVYGAKCLAGIALERHLKDATLSRTIEIRMRRKLPHESVERFRHVEREKFQELHSQLEIFIKENASALRSIPVLPEELSDRAQDNWEPLLAIAACAGDHWVRRGTQAAIALSKQSMSPAGAGNELLADIRDVFGNDLKLTTSDLIGSLCEDEERPWKTYFHGKPITPRQLSKLLEPYGIRPKTVRFGDRTPKGYELSDFKDAFRRYLAEAPEREMPPRAATPLPIAEDESPY
jgi:putative DNA primase/helicase